MKTYERKSIRLKGYDYSQAGEYFVTICTNERTCIFGEIVDGVMRLSEVGRMVDACWEAIPAHYENTRVDVFQIMPNHLHGIVEIAERIAPTPNHASSVGVEYVQPLRKRPKQHHYQHVIPKSLGSIIRSFKAAVTREVRRNKNHEHTMIWQRDFYDHIVRSDIEYFYIRRYIEFNPLLWHLDSDNPDVHSVPPDELQRTLKERHNLDDQSIEYLMEHEMNYRGWKEMAN